MKPLLFAGIRFSLAGGLVLLFALIRSRFSFTKVKKGLPPLKVTFITAFLQTFLMYTFYYIGIDRVPGALAAILMGTNPLVVSLISHLVFQNDRLHARKVIALTIGFLGVILLSVEKQFSFEGGWNGTVGVGILFLLLSVLLGSVSNVYVKKQKVEDPFLLTGLQLFIGGILLVLFSLLLEGSGLRQSGRLPLSFWLSLSWLSLVSAVTFSIWYALIRLPQVKVSELSLWKFIIPVCGALFSWILLPDETWDFFSLLGIVMISFSIIFYFRKEEESTTSPSNNKN